MRRIASLTLSLLFASPAIGEEPASSGAPGAARRLCVQAIELHETAPRPVPLPGVAVALLPERAAAASPVAPFPACAASESPCLPGDLRTLANGEACFEGVAAGRYFVRTRLDDPPGASAWDARTGPFDVPVADFERLEIHVGLDFTWAARSTVRPGASDRTAEASRTRPFAGPLRRAPGPSQGTRTLCVAAWSANYLEEIPEAWVVLEPVATAPAGSASTAASVAPNGRFERAAGERGAACFERVPPGRYVAHASVDGFWDGEIGPFEIPEWNFDRTDLRVSLDLQWASDTLQVLCEGWSDMPHGPAVRPE